MSTPKAQPTVVERFTDTFSHAEKVTESSYYRDETDGDGAWIADGIVMLFDGSVTQFGHVDTTEYTDAEYVRTDTVADRRAYGFRADDGHVHWVGADYVRTLANDVFDVDYGSIRSWAQTSTHDIDTVPDHTNAVLFDVPDSEYRVLIAPVVGEPE